MDVSQVRRCPLRGLIVIEAGVEPSLDQLLAAFDPKRHGGELMADAPRGAEAHAWGTADSLKSRQDEFPRGS